MQTPTLFVLLILTPVLAFTQIKSPVEQTPRFIFNHEFAPKRHTISEGLPTNSINCFVVDDDHFLWMGTDKGISRFDRFNFVSHAILKEGANQKMPTGVNSLVKSADGTIWVCHNNGICRFNPRNFDLKNYRIQAPKNHPSETLKVFRLLENETGEVYATTNKGFAIFNKQTESFIVQEMDMISFKGPPYNNTAFGKILEDKQLNGIWFTTLRHISFYDYSSKSYYSSLNNPKNWAIFNLNVGSLEITEILKDSHNKLWFSVRFRPILYCFDPQLNQIFQYQLDKDIPALSMMPQANKLYQLDERHLMCCLGRGTILLFDMIEKSFNEVNHRVEGNIKVPFGATVNDILINTDNNMYLATNTGLYLVEDRSYVLEEIPIANPVHIGAFTDLYIDNIANIWLRSNCHLLQKYDNITKKISIIPIKHNKNVPDLNYHIYPAKNNNFYTNTTTGTVLIETETDKFSRLSPQNGRFLDKTKIHGQYKDSLYFLYHRGSEVLFQYDVSRNYIDTLSIRKWREVALHSTFMDSKQRIWFGLVEYEGMEMFDPQKNELLKMKSHNKFGYLFNGPRYGWCMEDDKGNLLVASEDAGVLVIDPEINIIQHIDKARGLKTNNILRVSKINPNHLLIVSPSDFMLYDWGQNLPVLGKYRAFFEQTENRSYACAHNDLLYAASIDRIFIFDLKKILNEPYLNDRPFVSAILVDNKLLPPVQIHSGFQLKPGSYEIEFHIANHLNNTYSGQNWLYRLNGNADEWKQLDPSKKLVVNNLSQGHYSLELKVLDPFRKTEIEQAESIVRFEVLPFWYNTWWFRTMYILLAFSVLWQINRQSTLRKLAKQKADIEKQLALERERERIARDIHDDLGSGISAIHLLSNFSKNKIKDPEIQVEFAKIAASSAKLNRNIREIIWTINTAEDTLPSLAYFLRRYCAEFHENTGILTNFTDSNDLPETKISGELRRNLFLCVKETLNNVGKYANASEVRVSMTATNQKITIIIVDDGIGFNVDYALQKGGNGLKNILNRMEQIGGIANFESRQGNTEVRLEVIT